VGPDFWGLGIIIKGAEATAFVMQFYIDNRFIAIPGDPNGSSYQSFRPKKMGLFVLSKKKEHNKFTFNFRLNIKSDSFFGFLR
jgi:hypothetical protein